MGAFNQIAAITLICLFNPLTLCAAQRSLAFPPPSPPDEQVQSQTVAALRQISRGSEEFSLDIFQVSFQSIVIDHSLNQLVLKIKPLF